jgi:hypothetical protein
MQGRKVHSDPEYNKIYNHYKIFHTATRWYMPILLNVLKPSVHDSFTRYCSVPLHITLWWWLFRVCVIVSMLPGPLLEHYVGVPDYKPGSTYRCVYKDGKKHPLSFHFWVLHRDIEIGSC